MSKKYPLNRIKTRNSYTTDEISALLSVHKRTVFIWIKEGLKILGEKRKKVLVMGFDLKDFLKKKNDKRKTKLKPGEIYCLSCRKGVRARAGTEKIIREKKSKLKNKIGLCEFCGKEVRRICKHSKKH